MNPMTVFSLCLLFVTLHTAHARPQDIVGSMIEGMGEMVQGTFDFGGQLIGGTVDGVGQVIGGIGEGVGALVVGFTDGMGNFFEGVGGMLNPGNFGI